jgi:hypothetical protein
MFIKFDKQKITKNTKKLKQSNVPPGHFVSFCEFPNVNNAKKNTIEDRNPPT